MTRFEQDLYKKNKSNHSQPVSPYLCLKLLEFLAHVWWEYVMPSCSPLPPFNEKSTSSFQCLAENLHPF